MHKITPKYGMYSSKLPPNENIAMVCTTQNYPLMKILLWYVQLKITP